MVIKELTPTGSRTHCKSNVYYIYTVSEVLRSVFVVQCIQYMFEIYKFGKKVIELRQKTRLEAFCVISVAVKWTQNRFSVASRWHNLQVTISSKRIEISEYLLEKTSHKCSFAMDVTHKRSFF